MLHVILFFFAKLRDRQSRRQWCRALWNDDVKGSGKGVDNDDAMIDEKERRLFIVFY